MTDRKVFFIRIWNFDIVWNLGIVIWKFNTVNSEANYLYLNQVGKTRIFPLFCGFI